MSHGNIRSALKAVLDPIIDHWRIFGLRSMTTERCPRPWQGGDRGDKYYASNARVRAVMAIAGSSENDRLQLGTYKPR